MDFSPAPPQLTLQQLLTPLSALKKNHVLNCGLVYWSCNTF